LKRIPTKTLAFFSIIFLTSCSTIYVPNAINTPLLSKKNESVIGINTGITGTDLHSSYAITNSFAIMLNYSRINQGDQEKLKQNFGEVAIGYFKNLNNSNVTEFFLGMGYGETSSIGKIIYKDYIYEEIKADSKFYRFFAQLDFGIKGKIIETGISLRSSYVYFSNIKFSNSIFNEEISLNNIFVTPAFFFRIGSPIFKIQAQIGYSQLVSKSSFTIYQPLIMSLGVAIRFGS